LEAWSPIGNHKLSSTILSLVYTPHHPALACTCTFRLQSTCTRAYFYPILVHIAHRRSRLKKVHLFATATFRIHFIQKAHVCAPGVLFRLLKARKYQKEFFLDKKAKCQPWIIKKKPNFG
jgi:hypothetical protein